MKSNKEIIDEVFKEMNKGKQEMAVTFNVRTFGEKVAQAIRNECDKEMKCSQHIGTIKDCKEYAVMCYQCHLKKMTEFEKAVRNDEKQEVYKEVWDYLKLLQTRSIPDAETDVYELKMWLEESCKPKEVGK